MKAFACFLLLRSLLFLVCFGGRSVVIVVTAEEDLYKILGVKRSATTKEIKQAYRRKALDTHPDKNKGREEEAAKEFQKVVHAFEILSDKSSRNRYDRTGRSDEQRNSGGGSGGTQFQRGGFSWSFSWSSGGGSGRTTYKRRPRPKLKDKFEVKEAQSRILHIVSLEQLETVIVDEENGSLERNLLIVFFTPQLEQHLMDEMVYPYPFAAMSSQGIWWEDLLQTTAVRFHRSNTLTEFFGIPKGDSMTKPIFVFGKRGESFEGSKNSWGRLETNSRNEFDSWMWEQIGVQVTFINHHNHPIELYWIHGTKASLKVVLEPGEESVHTTRLSHEWWVRDARTDTHRDSPGRWKLTDNSMLIKWKILSDAHNQELIIPLRECYDISGHCGFWEQRGECNKNPTFMEEQCSKTCKMCSEDERNRTEYDEL